MPSEKGDKNVLNVGMHINGMDRSRNQQKNNMQIQQTPLNAKPQIHRR